MKAQSSVELIVILGIALLLLSILLYSGNEQVRVIRNEVNILKATQAVERIADAAEFVYSNGVGSTQVLRVDFPENIAPERVFLGEKLVNLGIYTGNEITDINAKTTMRISGSLPKTSGIHYISIKSREGYVEIGG